MKKSILGCLVVLAATLSSFSGEDNSSRDWVTKNFVKGQLPPFSFTYGGKESRTFIQSWEFRKETLPVSSPDQSQFLFTWRDPKTGLLVKCTVTAFSDYPVVEWVVRFSNRSKNNTPVLEMVKAVDHTFRYAKEGPVILHHSLGSNMARSDFQSFSDELAIGKNIYMTPIRGRSSHTTAFPFFNIEMPGGQGVLAAIGWTGKWFADVRHSSPTGCNLTAGMERMKLVLYPGEEIRTPLICLLLWQGEDRMTGHNQFRQFVLRHHSRMIDGKFAELPLANTLAMGGPEPCNLYNCSTENWCLACIERYKQFDLVPEVLWMDAGWHTGCGEWWENAGNWTVNTDILPRGLKPVSDAVHKAGARFLLWIEPERIVEGTQFSNLDPSFMIRIPDSIKNPEVGSFIPNMYLFNLGNPEACKWLIDYMSGLIRDNGVDYYRQDMNFDPYPYWVYNDKPNRIGVSEIRYIEGLYAYWDGLLENFPRLMIDNCAGGGRRLDLETTSRSSPLWTTDYEVGEPNGYQCHNYGLNFYLPLHGIINLIPQNYEFRSVLSSALATSFNLDNSKYPLSDYQRVYADFKRLRPYFYGDYYPLTPGDNITSDSIWMAYQMNRPDQGDGIILAFRRPYCPEERIQVKVKGLDPAATYELFYEDENIRVNKTGKELENNLDLYLKEKRSSILISYKKLS